jgi:F420-non-reducing hydrogenase iron-sulfur subunit
MAGKRRGDIRVVAFCCHYCAFTAADMAGTMRLQYPPNLRIVRLPCSGRVDANMLLHAFREGANGVMVAGCEEGSCHFMRGNIRAGKRVRRAGDLLREVGIDPRRLEMFHIAASQGPLFASRAREFIQRIADLEAAQLEAAKQEPAGPDTARPPAIEPAMKGEQSA